MTDEVLKNKKHTDCCYHGNCCDEDCGYNHSQDYDHDDCRCHNHKYGHHAYEHIGCSCCSGETNIFETENAKEEDEEFKKEISLLSIAGVFFVMALCVEFFFPQLEEALWLKALYLILFAVCGYPVIKLTGKAIAKKDFFNEYTLMASAAIAAILIGEMSESVGVMIFYRLGEALQDRASSKSRRSIRGLLAKKPMEARILRDGETVMVDPAEIKKGDLIQVLPGEMLPVDGIIKSGASQLDCSSITGEAIPVYAAAGAEVCGGTLAVDGMIIIEASDPFEDSTVSRMLEMIQNAIDKKAPTERFITRFAKWYTPAMFMLSICTMTLLYFSGYNFVEAVRRGLVLLVISCPCALVISIPLGYFGGIGAASSHGILIKGANVFDNLRHVKVAIFDKTGTLTTGRFKIAKVVPQTNISTDTLLKTAAIVEKGSTHPIAQAISKACEMPVSETAEITQIAGKGMRYLCGDEEIYVGNAELMHDNGIEVICNLTPETEVYVARNGEYLGFISVEDELRSDSLTAMEELRKLGLSTYMLTGDREEVARDVAEKLKLSGYKAKLMPEDKVRALREICHGNMQKSIFVGDGVNDGPVLVTSDTGIAMGGFGSQVAMEVSDAVILDDSLIKVADLFRIAKKTRIIVWENVFLAFGIKLLFMIFGICGAAGLWEAVFADVGVALLAVLNATRTSKV